MSNKVNNYLSSTLLQIRTTYCTCVSHFNTIYVSEGMFCLVAVNVFYVAPNWTHGHVESNFAVL